MASEQLSQSGGQNEARICLFSQRYFQRQLSACSNYEFEDLLGEVESVDILAGKPRPGYNLRRRISNQLARRVSISSLNPGIEKMRIGRQYELFFAPSMLLHDLLSLNACIGWRKRCKIAICWLGEAWAGEREKWKPYSGILSQFDHVILSCSASVGPMQDLIKKPCHYIPPGIDSIKFCPYPDPPLRSIDVYSIGRKSEIIHKSLLEMAERKKIFYIYDTITHMETACPSEHRSLIAECAKRSRYFLVNQAKVNRQFETGGQSEVGYRFFEGAAAGTVMIGEHPKTQVFQEQFGWPDSVIHVPYEAPNIAEILAELDSQPQRTEPVRKKNVVQSLLRHDWAYRWKAVLDIAGLNAGEALIDRQKRLKELAEVIESGSAE